MDSQTATGEVPRLVSNPAATLGQYQLLVTPADPHEPGFVRVGLHERFGIFGQRALFPWRRGRRHVEFEVHVDARAPVVADHQGL
jgi:hypothetical protein